MPLLRVIWNALAGAFNTPARVIYALVSVILALSIVTSPNRSTAEYLTDYGVSLDWYAAMLVLCAIISLSTKDRRILIICALPFALLILALSHYISTGQGSVVGLTIFLCFYWLAIRDMWHDT